MFENGESESCQHGLGAETEYQVAIALEILWI